MLHPVPTFFPCQVIRPTESISSWAAAAQGGLILRAGQDYKFVASGPAGAKGIRKGGPYAPCQLLEHKVPAGMPVLVIDRLKIVQIHHKAA